MLLKLTTITRLWNGFLSRRISNTFCRVPDLAAVGFLATTVVAAAVIILALRRLENTLNCSFHLFFSFFPDISSDPHCNQDMVVRSSCDLGLLQMIFQTIDKIACQAGPNQDKFINRGIQRTDLSLNCIFIARASLRYASHDLGSANSHPQSILYGHANLSLGCPSIARRFDMMNRARLASRCNRRRDGNQSFFFLA